MIYRRPTVTPEQLADFEASLCQHVNDTAPDLLAAIFGVTE